MRGVILTSLLLLSLLVSCRPAPLAIPKEPTREIVVSAEAAKRLNDMISDATRSKGPLRLLISEEELTSYVALNVQGSSVRSIAIWITRGGIHVSAELHLLGQHTVEAALDVTCHDGQLQTRMQHATLDRRPLPRFVLASIQEATNDALADAHLFIDVEQIILREGSVLILATRE